MKQRNIRIYSGLLRSICIWVGFALTVNGYAQQNDLIERAKTLAYADPDESLKIAQHLLKTSQDKEQLIMSNILIAKAQLIKGNYHEAVIYAFDQNNLDESAIDTPAQIELNLLRAELLRQLYLDQQSQDYLAKGEALANNLPTNSFKDSVQCLLQLEHVTRHLERRNNEEALSLIANFERQHNAFLKSNPTQKRALFLAKEIAFNNLSQFDSAKAYIDKTIKLLDGAKVNDLYQKAVIYKELSYLQLQEKAFDESEKSLFIAATFAEIIDNQILLMEINRDLAINCLASNKNIEHKVYNDKYLSLFSEVERTGQEAVNTLYTLLSDQSEQRISDEKETQNRYLHLLIAAIMVVLLFGAYVVLKGEGRKKRLREIINYLEVVRSKDLVTKPKATKKSKPKRIAIPEETEQLILSKLKRFEASKKFLNKDISLAVLAGQFETNTKYLSGVINKHYDDNFNMFINKLRVNYIINKLKDDSNYINYKISFLAEESGFSSHSSFATVFKSIVGMSPVTFIKMIQKERKGLKKKTTES